MYKQSWGGKRAAAAVVALICISLAALLLHSRPQAAAASSPALTLGTAESPDDSGETSSTHLFLPNILSGRGRTPPTAVTSPTPTPAQTPTPTHTPSTTPTVTPTGTPAPSETPAPISLVRRVNAPSFEGSSVRLPEAALVWFGRVDSTANYADGRIGYTDESLVITLQIFDRRLWYSAGPPQPATLAAWDAATLYFSLDGSQGDTPSPDSYRFAAQLNHWQPRAAYQAAYQGDGTGWVQSSQPFTTTTMWRGDAPNTGMDDRGWVASFTIPFSSLGVQGPPQPGETWGFGLAVHDRDDASGSAIPDQTWPETLSSQRPATWGHLRFDPPPYTPPNTQVTDVVTVRQGLNGVHVVDAHVGGGATCGEEYAPDYFEGWGNANDAGAEQFNIQNQGDVADWPCFSKYYVTFPTGTLPAGNVVISATLTLHLFGNAGYEPGQARPSLIQVHTLADGWEESTITWNNAPLPVENIAATWVDPVTAFPGWPGIPYAWDVSQAVADAYARGEAVRLALYPADIAYHSGKYFSSSDVEDWNAAARPTLTIWLGEP